MSVHYIYKQNGVKMMRPVPNREEYLSLRNGGFQKENVARIRQGDGALKASLVQMNYSCLPNEDGTLKGSKRMSTTVGMDIDFVAPKELSLEEKQAWLNERMTQVPELVMSKKDELGLQMLERSATKGYHLVFSRRPELSQEENLKWASELLGVKFDAQAKDITRVFFTTTEAELLFLDDAIFETTEAVLTNTNLTNLTNNEALKNSCNSCVPAVASEQSSSACNSCSNKKEPMCSFPSDYNGIPFADIIAKYWELFNGGKEPVEGDRNALTFELAVTIRSICGYSLERLMQVIPNYWAKPDGTCTQEDLTEYRQTLENALNKKPREGMSYRLKQVLGALKSQQGVKACGGTMTTPPPMPKKLPPLIKLLTKNVPLFYKPAVANAVFPALGAHLHGVKFRYWDNVEHEATFMNILIGRQSIGKGTIKNPSSLSWRTSSSATNQTVSVRRNGSRRTRVRSRRKTHDPRTSASRC